MKEKNNQKKKKITMDYLARIVQEGFLDMKERFIGIEEKLEIIEADVTVLKADVTVLKADVTVLKTDVKEIKANLNKKVDTIEYNTLEYRVEKLEKRSV